MLIDWFTFFAQVINFLVLVWLLKRFLYKPILKAIDEREKRIAGQLQDAEKLKIEATSELKNFQNKNSEFDLHRQEMMDNAKNEVGLEKQRLMEQARAEIEKLRLEMQETIRKEQKNLGADIIQRTQKQVFSIVRKTLGDLASVSLEQQMTGVFIKKLTEMSAAEKEVMVSGIKLNGGKIMLRSTFGLTPDEQTKITGILKREFLNEIKMSFEATPSLVSGIELLAGGYKLVWNIDDYLLSLEKSITGPLKSGI